MTEIKARFMRKLFSNEETGFSVYSAEPVLKDQKKVMISKWGTITVSGNFSVDEEELGERYFRMDIDLDPTSKYAGSYTLGRIHYDFPTKASEQWNFLNEANLVTTNQYKSLQKAFTRKEKILDIILTQPDKLTQAKGIGESHAKTINERVQKDKYRALVYTAFGKVDGIGPSVIKAIIHMGPDVTKTIKDIKKDPFILLKIDGVGFTTADKIRESQGIPLDDKNRCLHGIKYFITDTFESTGNTYADLNQEIKTLPVKLNVKTTTLIDYIKEVQNKNSKEVAKRYGFVIFSHFISTVDLFQAERFVGERTNYLMDTSSLILPQEQWNKMIDARLEGQQFSLSKEQRTFLEKVNSERILVLLGPGGAGKSWVTKIAVDLIMEAKRNVVIAPKAEGEENYSRPVGLYAPTARAAKVMKSYIGLDSSTIHRGLMKFTQAYSDHTFSPDDVLIVDESSMVDSQLMEVVYRAMKFEARIVLIGDSFQLPSVGPGNILYDLTHALAVPTVTFTKIYRQSEDSNIINYASDLRFDNFFLDPSARIVDKGDIVFINSKDPEEIKELGMDYYKDLLADHAYEDIMMLSPVNKGPAGRKTLNKEIQKLVNGNAQKSQYIAGKNAPDEADRQYFREGDYITIVKNDYARPNIRGQESPIINGDMGRIFSVDTEAKKVRVDIEGEYFDFDFDEVKNYMDHLWAITIHKSQGGQANSVIILIPSNAGWGLSANMLYTAITRAQKQCYVIGDFNVLNRSSKKYANFKRKTIIALERELKRMKERRPER